jgi:predicted nucleic acid-binding protein
LGAATERGYTGVRRIICNTGPLLHLGEAQVLALLALAGEVSIPLAVDLEMLVHQQDWQHQRPAWIIIQRLELPYNTAAAQWQHAGLLHGGEAAAVALAQQLHANWFLTDDTAARVFAQSLGLEVHGSLGIVLWAAAMGQLQRAEAERALDRLAQASLWVSARGLAAAKTALEQLY